MRLYEPVRERVRIAASARVNVFLWDRFLWDRIARNRFIVHISTFQLVNDVFRTHL